jgi:hypothetical protein
MTFAGTKPGKPVAMRTTPIEPLNQELTPQETARRIHLSALKAATPAEVLRRLQSLPQDAPREQENALFLQIRALLALHPETATQFTEYLQRTPATVTGLRVLTDAIRDAGTTPGQLLLLQTAQRRHEDVAFLTLALPALGLARIPLAETESLLTEVSTRTDEPGQMAMLLMGSLIYGAPTRYPSLLNRLHTRLTSEMDTARLLLVLGAVGNAGQTTSLPYLQPLLADSRREVRRAALSALRLIPGTQAEHLLCNALIEEKEPTLRATAAFMLTFIPRGTATRTALENAQKDPATEVRDAATRALESFLPSVKEVKP